jgi:hypothetical protein
MDNFDDPNESEFTARLVGSTKRAVIPGVGVVVRFETVLPPQAAAGQTAPVYQVLLTIPMAQELIEGLRLSVETAIMQQKPPKAVQ